jgi:hypothetical protein
MNKKIKFVISGILAFLIVYVGYIFFNFIRNTHHTEMNDYKRYLWIFKDSAKTDIDTFFFDGDVRDRDILYQYFYRNNYYIYIWEFKDLGNTELSDIPLTLDSDLENVRFESAEIFNVKSRPLITVKLGCSFNRTMHVYLNKRSKITKEISSNHYKGFYGTIDKMSFDNEKKEPQILFDFIEEQQVLLLLYKRHRSFYVIIVYTGSAFDEKIINILDLR